MELFGYAGLAAVIVPFVLLPIAFRLVPDDVASRYAPAVAFVAAFLIGYGLLPSWAPLWPSQYWHWIAYLGVAAVVIGPIGLVKGVTAPERWLLQLLFCVVAATLLTPTWPDLRPPRPAFIAISTAYLFLLCAMLDPLSPRVGGRRLVAYLALASFASAIAVAVFVSIKFGRLSTLSASALGGCWLAGIAFKGEIDARGLTAAFAVLTGGSALVAAVNPDPPLLALPLIAAAPLALWACAFGPACRLRKPLAEAARLTLVLIPIAIGVALALLAESAADLP